MWDRQIASAAFFPRPDAPYGPEAPGAYDHAFDVDGARLRLRVFPAKAGLATVLFFHGNGETGRDYDFAAAHFQDIGCALVVGEYRGYGPCTGEPTLDNYLTDAHQTLDQTLGLIKAQGLPEKLVVMGRSLGSAPAIELARNRAGDLKGLIIESGFARALPLLALMGVPVQQLGLSEQDGPNSLEKIKSVTVPTLVMHATGDQIIPVEDGRMLHEACGSTSKKLFLVEHAGHNDIQVRAGQAYFTAIRQLIDG